MKHLAAVLVVAMLHFSCISEKNYTFSGLKPDALVDADTASRDGAGDLGLPDRVSPVDADAAQVDGHADADAQHPEAVEEVEVLDVHVDVADAQDIEVQDIPQLDAEDVSNDVPKDQEASEDICIPSCDGLECGDDGCGGSCGECDDSNPCTDDSCNTVDGLCVFAAVPDGDEPKCDDGNPCTKDLCASGACDNPLFPLDDLADEIAGGLCLCATDEDCAPLNDADLCNGVLHCTASQEGVVPQGTLVCLVDETTIKEGTYDDGLWCNGLEGCDPATGGMVEGVAPGLDDGVSCTVDACDEENNLAVHTPDSGKCDDGSACTLNLCDSKAGCTYPPIECDDKNVCTNDGCDGLTGCFHTPVGCDDGVVCTASSCDPAGGCVHKPDNAYCDDGNVCNGVETCDAAKGCQAGTPLVCDDQNACNGMETCDAATGCQQGAPPVCDDGSACSENQCDPKTGCEYPPLSCDDASLCTNDGCDGLTGCFHTPVSCDDGQFCTKESCDPLKGCQHMPDDLFCDDGNPCTEDSCNPENGCVYSVAALDATPCDDGDPCTQNDVCTGGVCLPGPYDQLACNGDLDHDGLLGKADSCPYAFDPQQLDLDDDGKKDACEPLPAGFAHTRKIALSQVGVPSTWRRTHEPVEVPLANGIIDESVLLYLPFENGLDDGSQHGVSGSEMIGTGAVYVPSAAEELGQALSVGGTSCLMTPDDVPYPLSELTIMAWFKGTGDAWILDNGNKNSAGFQLRVNVWANKCAFEVGTGANELDSYVSLVAGFDPNLWHHVAFSLAGGQYSVFVDGRLLAAGTSPAVQVTDDGKPLASGCDNDALAPFTDAFLVDELLLFNRALTPDEIETYYRSKAPYGTRFTPSSQVDFDDIRVTEKTGTGDPLNTGETVKRARILGPRPHSDTPCPMAQDDGTWKDRDDLCGVVGYWRLDGDGKDVLGKYEAVLSGPAVARGRFGEPSGGLAFDGVDDEAIVAHDSDQNPASGTVELFFRTSDLSKYQGLATKMEVWPNFSQIAWEIDYQADPGNGLPRLDFMVSGGTSGAQVNCMSLPVTANRWHHVAMTWNADKLVGYLDGLPCGQQGKVFVGPLVGEFPIRLGGHVHNVVPTNRPLLGTLDDVIIHSVAKSPDYIYHRANPGVPKVQFLANTVVLNQGTEQAPKYPMREYSIYWGDAAAKSAAPLVSSLADAPAIVPDRCYGLLNGCMGYAGWWRFNEGRGTVAVDSSGWKNNGLLYDGPTWRAGSEGTALGFDGFNDRVYVPGVPDISDGEAFNLEAVALASEVCQEPGYTDRIVDRASGQGGYSLGMECVSGKAKGSVQMPPNTWPSVVGPVLVQDKATALSMNLNSNTLALHAEGVQPVSKIVAAPDTSTSAVFSIATVAGATSELFNGTIDSVRLMNRALAPDEFLHYPMVSWGYAKGNWELDCAGTICPPLAGYDIYCNPQDHCEYKNKAAGGANDWDVWIWIPPGKTKLGSPATESGHELNEEDPSQPDKRHPVIFAQGYFIAKYEITVAHYDFCKFGGGCTAASTQGFEANGWGLNAPSNGRLYHPQNGLTWQQAKTFCAWFASGGRLPSEAEWEYAAKGPVHRKYPWGDTPEPTCENGTAVFNPAGNVSGYGCTSGGTWTVGSKASGASWSGALDMSGNVWEWNEDYYHASYDGAPADGSAWGEPIDSTRVMRGGSFTDGVVTVRAAKRTYNPHTSQSAHIGGRCVRPLIP